MGGKGQLKVLDLMGNNHRSTLGSLVSSIFQYFNVFLVGGERRVRLHGKSRGQETPAFVVLPYST